MDGLGRGRHMGKGRVKAGFGKSARVKDSHHANQSTNYLYCKSGLNMRVALIIEAKRVLLFSFN